ncbi:MAG: 4Fe-4S binding protein [Treponema sp.]|jgi:dissimilatory sulfite reductase (desulfoviridin) alpha/beta subunit|nr:4Fe-4S binding protein [Treponema sp.]
MAEVDYAALKKGGLMRQVQKDTFSMRLKVVGGQVRAEGLAKISQVATKYGQGYVHLTSRQGIEIPFIALSDIETVKRELADAGVNVGVCGPRVRTITACQGAAVCPSGAIETGVLAEELDARYFGRELPHKFKLGITGCKNNCLKAEENDMGIKGGIFPAWNKGSCTFCGLCEAVCPVGVVKVDTEAGELAFEEKGCVYCGKCVKSCPVGAWEGKSGYILSFGGMFGNEIQEGRSLLPILFDQEQVLKAADTAIKFYQENGKPSERFGKTLGRTGTAGLQKQLEEALQ